MEAYLRCVYTSLAKNVVDVLDKAMCAVYGEGAVSIEEIEPESLRVNSHMLMDNDTVVAYVVPFDLADNCDPGMINSDKYIEYKSYSVLISHLNEKFGLDLVDETVEAVAPRSEDPKDLIIKLLQDKVNNLEEQVSDLSMYSGVSDSELKIQLEKKSNTIKALEGKVQELEAIIGDQETLLNSKEGSVSNDEVLKLQQENLRLRDELDVLKESEDSSNELFTLRKSLKELKSNPFVQLESYSDPASVIQINLPYTARSEFRNIHFVFSGCDGALSSTYKYLKTLSVDLAKSGKVLIMDLSTETAADYHLGEGPLVQGTEWLSVGGDLSDYISDCRVSKRVKIFCNGNSYFNDAYLTKVNWTKRWSEIIEQGYSIIMYCGPLYTLVGRMLYSSFSSLSTPHVVAKGTLVGLRSLILNLRGVVRDPKLFVSDLNPKAQDLYKGLCNRYDVSRLGPSGSVLR